MYCMFSSRIHWQRSWILCAGICRAPGQRQQRDHEWPRGRAALSPRLGRLCPRGRGGSVPVVGAVLSPRSGWLCPRGRGGSVPCPRVLFRAAAGGAGPRHSSRWRLAFGAVSLWSLRSDPRGLRQDHACLSRGRATRGKGVQRCELHRCWWASACASLGRLNPFLQVGVCSSCLQTAAGLMGV